MFDFRPVGYVIGLLVAALGATMLLPMSIDYLDGDANWTSFLFAVFVTVAFGGGLSIACANGKGEGLTIQQTFLLTTGVWVILPLFGAIPFWIGAPEARFVDAFFEATSGLTTTGATVISGLDDLPRGILFWRSLSQWLGGVGIVVFAMVFMPALKVGGMQIFRSEGFDTFGKILPRAAEIAGSIMRIYVALTVLCTLTYLALGMMIFDALAHALTTISTGGFSTRDASFGAFQGNLEYAATLFMILAALPFVRYVQILTGTAKPLLHDPQVKAFLALVVLLVAVMTLFRVFLNQDAVEPSLREAVFNTVSILTGTGYASTDYQLWGPFPMVFFFLIGLIGGCAGSTSCSIKIFRFQILFTSIKTQINRLHSPNGVFEPRYDHRKVSDEVISSVMGFFMMFMLTLAVLAVLLGMTGLDMITSISGAASALANIGPGLGEVIGPAGNFGALNDVSKWLLSAGMIIGRLELMVVYVLFTVNFWRG